MSAAEPAADGRPGAAAGQIPPVIWMMPDRPARGPRPAHSRAAIATAAVAIADADGLDAVTMRRVAAEIGCGTMTLYRYVPTKDHLFDLMIDTVAGEIDLPGPSGDWRADLRQVALSQRDLLLRHPWLALLQSGRPSFGPNSLRSLEAGFGLIEHLGLDVDGMLIMFNTLISFVRGAAIAELAEQEAQRRTGLTQEEWQDRMAPYVRELMASGRYPMFNRVITEARLPHSDNGPDEGFRLELERVLDGLAAGLPTPPG